MLRSGQSPVASCRSPVVATRLLARISARPQLRQTQLVRLLRHVVAILSAGSHRVADETDTRLVAVVHAREAGILIDCRIAPRPAVVSAIRRGVVPRVVPRVRTEGDR